MTASTTALTDSPQASPPGPIRVLAHNEVAKRLGHWTRERHFDVRASRGSVVLDLQARRQGRYPTIDDPSR
jgi:hypothetical protein